MVKPNAIFDKETGKIIVQIPAPPFNCLAFKGAGTRGPAHGAALKVFAKYGLLDEVQFVIGSSAGAVAALAVSLGYQTENELNEVLCHIPMETFLEGKVELKNQNFFTHSYLFLSFLFSKKKLSVSSGKIFLQWLEALVEKKFADIFIEKGINK